eukprot:6181053-Pleurochrysis_carterae.AAC.2
MKNTFGRLQPSILHVVHSERASVIGVSFATARKTAEGLVLAKVRIKLALKEQSLDLGLQIFDSIKNFFLI